MVFVFNLQVYFLFHVWILFCIFIILLWGRRPAFTPPLATVCFLDMFVFKIHHKQIDFRKIHIQVSCLFCISCLNSILYFHPTWDAYVLCHIIIHTMSHHRLFCIFILLMPMYYVTSSYILCHIIIHTMSHNHTYYVTSSYTLSRCCSQLWWRKGGLRERDRDRETATERQRQERGGEKVFVSVAQTRAHTQTHIMTPNPYTQHRQ